MYSMSDLRELDSSLYFQVTPTGPGHYRISGAYLTSAGTRIVLGIETTEVDACPAGFIESEAGFYFVYLVGTGEIETFDIDFNAQPERPDQSISAFIRRWYSVGEIYVSIEQSDWAPNTFVLGSCVSRDSLDFGGMPISGYRARSSIAAVTSPPVEYSEDQLKPNRSEFQRRMVRGDLSKSNLSLAAASPGGIVLVDFIDERFKVIERAGKLLTLSPELTATNVLRTGRVIDPFGEEYFSLFQSGWETLLRILDHKKIVVSRAFWAPTTEEGAELPHTGIERENSKLAKLYSIVENSSHDIDFIEYSESELVAAASHRWGVSPFHYTSKFYSRTVEHLSAFENFQQR